MRPRIAIHGHFYQPPRENPWTGVVERQPSASPEHDWNVRIARECYLPNLQFGNLSKLSFNFGPTLLSWADSALPELARGVVENDRAATARTPHGPAMAQLFSHPIAPLLTKRDRVTQIRWGKMDFERRFGRAPEGMWLPECAVDLPTLRDLADENIKFTILSPTQARRFRDPGGEWRDAPDTAEVAAAPARVDLGDGRFIKVYFYDLQLSQSISFGESLTSAARLVDALKRAALARGDGGFVFVATDGETFGHHKRSGAEALAGAIVKLTDDPDVEFITIPELAASEEPARVVELYEPSAWSCAHGVGRWSRDCGCNMGGGQQRWRAPLREAVETLTQRIHQIFEHAGSAVFRDPWDARDRSGGLAPAAIVEEPWFRESLRFPEREGDRRAALRLLEMERQCFFANTSCGWFFDDIAGIEPVQNLRCAARAIELSADGAPMEDKLLTILRRAPGNDARMSDGAIVYKRMALTAALDAYGIAARAAFRWLFAAEPGVCVIANCEVTPVIFSRDRERSRRLVTGNAMLRSAFDFPDRQLAFAALSLGDGECFVYFMPGNDRERARHAASAVTAAFKTGRTPECLSALTHHFGARAVHIQDLGDDDRASIAQIAALGSDPLNSGSDPMA